MTIRRGVPLVLLPLLLAGCGDPTVEPQDAAVVTARQQSQRVVDDQLAALVDGRSVLATGRQDGCEKGQNNWKVRTNHAYECTITEVAVVEAAQVRPALVADHERAVALGCVAGPRDGLLLAVDYWDQFEGRDQNGHPYGARDLPLGRYECADTATTVILRPADPAEGDQLRNTLDAEILSSGSADVTVSREPADLAAVTASKSPMVMIINVRRTYYMVDW